MFGSSLFDNHKNENVMNKKNETNSEFKVTHPSIYFQIICSQKEDIFDILPCLVIVFRREVLYVLCVSNKPA